MFESFLKGIGSTQEAAPKIQDMIKSSLERALSVPNPHFDANTIASILAFTGTVDDSGELMLSLCDLLDKNCQDPLYVFKCLKIIYICLTKAHDTFFPACQAFAPEVQTIALLCFQSQSVQYREYIHRLSSGIYHHIIHKIHRQRL